MSKMNVAIKSGVAFLLVAGLAACQTQPARDGGVQGAAQTAAVDPNLPACAKNFEVGGSFFAGKRYTTHAPLPGLTPDAAYKKTYAEISKRGWQIISSDKDARSISASQGVAFSGAGKTVPFNIMIGEEKGKGSNVSFVFALSGGLMTSEEGVKTTFCDIVKSIGG